jgi:hypothetical protein
MGVCNDCLIRPAQSDTGLCPTCELNREIHAAQASNRKVETRFYEVTFYNLTEADWRQNRRDGWQLLSGTPERSLWRMDLSQLVENGSAA